MKNITLISNFIIKNCEKKLYQSFYYSINGQINPLNKGKYTTVINVFIQKQQKLLMKMNAGVSQNSNFQYTLFKKMLLLKMLIKDYNQF